MRTILFFSHVFVFYSLLYHNASVYTGVNMTVVTTCTNRVEWDEYIKQHDGHPLQLWAWGEVKSAHNWRVERVFVRKGEQTIGAAQLLIRTLPKPLNTLVYVPRGPVVTADQTIIALDALRRHAKQMYSAIAITIEPDRERELIAPGWKRSQNTILIPRTLVLDLTQTTDELQAAMAKKTRQYIRKSSSEAIDIRRVESREELDQCLALYKMTSKRAGFAVHDDDYYYDIFDQFGDDSPVYGAFSGTQAVAFLWLATSQSVAFELYGGMNDDGQRLRANYALKWHAIEQMKARGVTRYDFNGLLNDGVSTFKQSFASHENMLVGTYDYALSPLYIVWNKGLPFAKKLVRKLKSLR